MSYHNSNHTPGCRIQSAYFNTSETITMFVNIPVGRSFITPSIVRRLLGSLCQQPVRSCTRYSGSRGGFHVLGSISACSLGFSCVIISQNNTPRPKISDAQEKDASLSRTSGAVHGKEPLPILVAMEEEELQFKLVVWLEEFESS